MKHLVALFLLVAANHLVSAAPLFMDPDPLFIPTWNFSLESGDSTSNDLIFTGSGGLLQNNTIGFSFDGGASFSHPNLVLNADAGYFPVSATPTASGTQLGAFGSGDLLQFNFSLVETPTDLVVSLNATSSQAVIFSVPPPGTGVMNPDPALVAGWSFSLASIDEIAGELIFTGSGGLLQNNTIGFSFDGGATFAHPSLVLNADANYSLVTAAPTASGTQLGLFAPGDLLQFNFSLGEIPSSVQFSLNQGLVEADLLFTPSTVPEPSVLLLFGPFGLWLLVQKRRRAQHLTVESISRLRA